MSASYAGLGVNLRRFAALQVQTVSINQQKGPPDGRPFVLVAGAGFRPPRCALRLVSAAVNRRYASGRLG